MSRCRFAFNAFVAVGVLMTSANCEFFTQSCEDETHPPVIDYCPQSVTRAADQGGGANVPDFKNGPDDIRVRGHDFCNPLESASVSQEPQAGTRVGRGTHKITVTVFMEAGLEESTCEINFTVTAPVACPSGMYDVYCIGQGGAVKVATIPASEAEGPCNDPTLQALKPYCTDPNQTGLGCNCVP